MLEEWRPGQDIRMSANPDYFRAAEGLPAFDVLLFRFIPEGGSASIEQLLTEDCDILDETAIADALNVDVLDHESFQILAGLTANDRIKRGKTMIKLTETNLPCHPRQV